MENLRVRSGALGSSPLSFFLEILEISLASTLPTLMEMYWKWLEMALGDAFKGQSADAENRRGQDAF